MEAVQEREGPPRRFTLRRGTTLRQHAAQGTLINGAFNAALTFLGFIKGFLLAAFLTPGDYGIWGILLITLGTLSWLKQVGIADKYIQQDDDDQELAFQRAFTLELVANALLLLLILIAVPLMVLLYGRPELLLPGFAIALLVPAGQLQVPFWILYRRLEFAQQRKLQAVDPVVSFVATAALAIAGAGYWSLVGGMLLGAYAGAVLAVRSCPYPLALSYDRGTFRDYLGFSAPLFLAALGGIIIGQGSIFFSEHAIGLAAAGVITLAAQISLLAQRVDDVLTSTLYPIVCAVADRKDVLLETFEKSNRIALMWAMPFGIGLGLFAGDLVHLVLGDKWEPAITVLRCTGITAAVTQLGFNWTAYVRALGNTKPIAIDSLIQASVFCCCVPLLYVMGLDGYAVTVLILGVTVLAVRAYFLARIFDGFALARHAVRALLPSVPAVLVLLAFRVVEPTGWSRGWGLVLVELALYGLVTVAATWAFERTLLREAMGYMRRRAARAGELAGPLVSPADAASAGLAGAAAVGEVAVPAAPAVTPHP